MIRQVRNTANTISHLVAASERDNHAREGSTVLLKDITKRKNGEWGMGNGK